MARLSIYISDELKARMDAVGESVNWSEIVRPALQAVVATEEHRKGQNMTTAVERLRASKQESVQNDQMQGRRDGREWAEHKADYEDLRRLAKIMVPPNDYEGAFSRLIAALNYIQSETEVREYCFGEGDEYLSDEYVVAWIEGANEFFEEVRDQL